MVDLRRSVGEDVADANPQPVVVQSSGMIQAGEGKKFDVKFWDRRSRAEFAMGSLEDGLNILHARLITNV